MSLRSGRDVPSSRRSKLAPSTRPKWAEHVSRDQTGLGARRLTTSASVGRIALSLLFIAATLIICGVDPSLLHAQCRESPIPCPPDLVSINPIGFPGVGSPGENNVPNTPGNTFHAPLVYPAQNTGKSLGGAYGLSHVNAAVPHVVVSEPVDVDWHPPPPPPGTLGEMITQRVIDARVTPNPKIPRDTSGIPAAPGNQGDPEGKGKSDPVNHGTGEFILSHVDLAFPGFGVPFQFRRTYGSRRDFQGPLGVATDHSYNIRLVPSPVESCDGNLIYMAGNGTSMEFTAGPRVAGAQTFSAPSGVLLDLRALYDGGTLLGYFMKHPDGTVALFDQHGFVISIKDLNDRGLTFSWSREHERVDFMTDSVGRRIDFQYDSADRVIRIWESHSQLQATYVYDDATGDLLQATDQAGRSEVYQYQTGIASSDTHYIPERALVDACEAACAPSATSCHAGGACESFSAAAHAACRSDHCAMCLPNCTHSCDDQCDAGRTTCMSGTPGHPGCVAQSDALCPIEQAREKCLTAWEVKVRGNPDPLTGEAPLVSPSEVCRAVEDRAVEQCHNYWPCTNETDETGCNHKILQCLACVTGNHDGQHITHADCGCFSDGLSNLCGQGFFGVQPGTCGCDPATGACPGIAERGGCAVSMQRSCVNVLSNACADDCVDNCKTDCVRDSCLADCNVPLCNAQCDAMDYAGYCSNQCVPECVNASHNYTGTFPTNIVFPLPTGPKFGYGADLVHNMLKIFNADGSLRLENVYGNNLALPSYDAVVLQKTGDQTITLGYRDYEAENGLITHTPAPGTPGNTALVSTSTHESGAVVLGDGLSADVTANLPPLEMRFTTAFDAFQNVEICPGLCERPAAPGPGVDYIPIPDGIIAMPQISVVDDQLGGFAGDVTGGPAVPPTVFPLATLGWPATQLIMGVPFGGFASAQGPAVGIDLRMRLAGRLVTLRRNANNTLTVSGDPQVLSNIRTAGELTLVSDQRGVLRLFPGRPQSIMFVASGACSAPFRGQLNSSGQLQLAPVTACSADFSVSPMASLVTDSAARARFLGAGSIGLALTDLFAPSALMNGRWFARWLAVPGLQGRYELSLGAGAGAAPTGLSARIASMASRTPLLRPIVTGDPANRPFYVFHLPKPLRPTTNTSVYAWDQESSFDPSENRTDCLTTAIREPRRATGSLGTGPRPARATVVMDAYGVASTFYYDHRGHQIRAVNNGTNATHSFNYDSADQLVAIEDQAGARRCLRYNAQGKVLSDLDLPAPFFQGDATPIRHKYEYQANPSRITKVFDPRDPEHVVSSYTWDPKGNLLTSRDAFNSETRYIPSEFGPPASSTAPSGDRTTMTWDRLTGALAATTLDADGESPVTFATQHNEGGRPVGRTEPLGDARTWVWNGPVLQTEVRTADGLQETVSYSYDENHWLRQETNGRYRITTTRDLFGRDVRTEAVALDGSAQPAVSCKKLGFDGRLIEEVLPEGTRVKPEYDGEGRVISMTMGYLPKDPTSTWDQGCVVPVAGPTVDPADIGRAYDMGHVIYDAAGRLTFAQDAFGSEIHYEYDGFGRTIIVRDELNRSVRMGYNATDQVIWRAAYDAAGASLPYRRPALSDPGLMGVLEYQYDEGGKLRREDAWHFDANHVPIGDGMATTTYSHDPIANSVTVTDDAGFSTRKYFDGAGRMYAMELPTGARVETSYRNSGRTVVSSWPSPTPNNLVERTTLLNAWGAPIAVRSGDQHGADAVLRSYAYDAERNLRSTTGPGGIEFEADYDAFGRPLHTTSTFSDSARERVGFVYNRDGLVLSRTSEAGGLPATTSARYDSLGRIRSLTRPNQGIESLMYYNGSSNVSRVDDPRGVIWIHDYYEDGSPAGIAALAGVNATNGRARRFSYDGLGRLIEARDKGADYNNPSDDIVTTMRWDSLGNKTLEWDTNTGLSQAVSHAYDGRGFPVSTNLGPFALTRTFDALGRQDQIRAGTTTLASFAYRGLGGPISRTLGSGVTASYAYDRLNRLDGITEVRAGTPLASWRYEIPLDGIPRLAGLRKGQASEVSSIFIVDRVGRLLGEEDGRAGLDGVQVDPMAPPTSASLSVLPTFGTGPSWRTYTLDGRSNWTSRNAADPALRTTPTLNAFDGYETFGGASSSFDPAGNLTQLGQERYRVDDFGELVDASRGGERRLFIYDALGRRVREEDPATGVVKRFTFDGQRRVSQVNADGSWIAAVDGAGLDQHVALVSSSGSKFYLHQDRARSVYLVTDQSGNPVEWTSYTAFGEATMTDGQGHPIAASAVGNRFGYQGQPYIGALGLVDMRSRLYRPAWGRFLSPDAAGLGGGANLYAFVGSSPLKWWDPMGFGPEVVDAGVPSPPGGSPWDPETPPLHYRSDIGSFWDQTGHQFAGLPGATMDLAGGAVNGVLPIWDHASFGNDDLFFASQAATATMMQTGGAIMMGSGAAMVVTAEGCMVMTVGGCAAPAAVGVAGGIAIAGTGAYIYNTYGNVREQAAQHLREAEEGGGSAEPASQPAERPPESSAEPRVESKNGYDYSLDEKGRVTRVEGDLSSNPAQGRNPGAQLRAGGANRLPTDEGGHFIGRRFNGPMEEFNHFAQDMNLNRGAYKSMENSWQRAMQQGLDVSVEITPHYAGDSLRPVSIDVAYTIDGVPYEISFMNRPGGI